jgi:molybdate transport system substrate-binding protein
MLRRRVVLLIASAGGVLMSACAGGLPRPVPAATPAPPPVSNALATGGTPPPTLAPEATYTPGPTPTLRARVSPDPTAVVVYAVSSLGGALSELAGQFMLTNAQATGVTYKFDKPALLTSLIQQGADADVFACSDTTQIDGLRQAGLVDGPDAVMVRDKLVIVVSQANPQQIQSLKDLGNPGVRFIIPAPTGETAAAIKATFDSASSDPAYGADFATRADRNVLARDGNDAFVFNRVVIGEVTAAVVYASSVDPSGSARVQVIDIPDAVNTLMAYSIVVLKNGTNARGGHAFMSYVLSDPAQRQFARWGFTPVTP